MMDAEGVWLRAARASATALSGDRFTSDDRDEVRAHLTRWALSRIAPRRDSWRGRDLWQGMLCADDDPRASFGAMVGEAKNERRKIERRRRRRASEEDAAAAQVSAAEMVEPKFTGPNPGSLVSTIARALDLQDRLGLPFTAATRALAWTYARDAAAANAQRHEAEPIDLAAELGVSRTAYKSQLAKGRAMVARMYPSAGALIVAVLDTDAGPLLDAEHPAHAWPWSGEDYGDAEAALYAAPGSVPAGAIGRVRRASDVRHAKGAPNSREGSGADGAHVAHDRYSALCEHPAGEHPEDCPAVMSAREACHLASLPGRRRKQVERTPEQRAQARARIARAMWLARLGGGGYRDGSGELYRAPSSAQRTATQRALARAARRQTRRLQALAQRRRQDGLTLGDGPEAPPLAGAAAAAVARTIARAERDPAPRAWLACMARRERRRKRHQRAAAAQRKHALQGRRKPAAQAPSYPAGPHPTAPRAVVTASATARAQRALVLSPNRTRTSRPAQRIVERASAAPWLARAAAAAARQAGA